MCGRYLMFWLDFCQFGSFSWLCYASFGWIEDETAVSIIVIIRIKCIDFFCTSLSFLFLSILILVRISFFTIPSYLLPSLGQCQGDFPQPMIITITKSAISSWKRTNFHIRSTHTMVIQCHCSRTSKMKSFFQCQSSTSTNMSIYCYSLLQSIWIINMFHGLL